jgi:hypothetical protein
MSSSLVIFLQYCCPIAGDVAMPFIEVMKLDMNVKNLKNLSLSYFRVRIRQGPVRKVEMALI